MSGKAKKQADALMEVDKVLGKKPSADLQAGIERKGEGHVEFTSYKSDDHVTVSISGDQIVEIDKLFGPLVAWPVRVRLDTEKCEWVFERQRAPVPDPRARARPSGVPPQGIEEIDPPWEEVCRVYAQDTEPIERTALTVLEAAERNVLDAALRCDEKIDESKKSEFPKRLSELVEAVVRLKELRAADRSRQFAHEPIEHAHAGTWPMTIIMDRYSGSYSNAPWTAFNCYAEQVPTMPSSDDSEAMEFWDVYRGHIPGHKYEGPLIGLGSTPTEAAQDLARQIKPL